MPLARARQGRSRTTRDLVAGAGSFTIQRTSCESAPEYRVLEIELLFLTSVVVLGTLAQWIAWRTRLPGILVLLAFGLAAGQFLDPEERLGSELLFSFVSPCCSP